jgi:hypothetical protein
MSRLSKAEYRDAGINLLNPVDEWLYLAQHYCFHLFAGQKWLKDLWLLQSRFSHKEIAELLDVAGKFHFKRIVTAVVNCLKNNYDNTGIKVPVMIEKKHFLFDRLFRKPNLTFAFKGNDRIIAAFWEFLFIDETGSRLKAFSRLLFPDFSMFYNIYNLHSRLLYFVTYPFHILALLSCLTIFLPLIWYKCK